MTDFQLVKVTWLDAHAVTTGWQAVDALDPDPCVVESVGFVLPDVKAGHVTLAQSWIEGNEEVDHVLSIPIKMVTRLEKLTATALLPIEPASE